MLIAAALQVAGFFEWITGIAINHLAARHLLPTVIFVSGILSAFLVNDVVCLLMTPLILQVCRRLSKPVGPYLLALANASNVGSTATITGNPQNVFIGSLSGIGYRDFLKSLGPVAAIGLFVVWAIFHWRGVHLGRRDLHARQNSTTRVPYCSADLSRRLRPDRGRSNQTNNPSQNEYGL